MDRRPVAAGEAARQQQLPPGFRFQPTDEELVVQYLRRKALARPLPAAVIPVVHAAATLDPWDLPGVSEGEAAYFFSLRQAPASGRGSRRRACSGYWKATGKEKPVFVQLPSSWCGGGNGKRQLVGVKTALAFHRGKGKPSRTGWVMHEYRLAAVSTTGQKKEPGEWVVCRVSLKRGARRPAGGEDRAADVVVHRAAPRREDAGHHQPSPSSSCVTDTCHVSDQEEISSSK